MEAAARSTLSNLVEDHITSLVREAACVQRHAKRARFYQQSNERGGRIRRRLHADDVNLALQWRGSEKLYATNAGGIISPEGVSERNQVRIDLNEYVRSEMSTQPPNEIGLTVHWLAVDGIQPNVPQNPPLQETAAMVGGPGGRIVHRVLDDDDENEGSKRINNGYGRKGAASASTAIRTTTASPSGVSIRQLLPRLLSEELQLYFTRITIAVERGTMDQQAAALASVAKDAGTQELVPFFSRFVSRQILEMVGKTDTCRTLVRLADALISNPNLHLGLHLHQMLPALITCVVARRLSSRPFDDHWGLREEAARTLVKACNAFGDQYTALKARVIKTLCEAMSPDKPLSTQYGGMAGLSLFGPKTVDAFILPLAKGNWEKWEKALESQGYNNSADFERRFEIQQCQHALLNALGIFMRNVSLKEQAERLRADAFVDVFGEKLIPLQATFDDEGAMTDGAGSSDSLMSLGYSSCIL
uniref:TAF6 C-terminal HEAT repeat domain-containing protein n=1 Tax=Ditylum brightwellii TaxID=49249 RepID=A0A6S8RS04_9STRA